MNKALLFGNVGQSPEIRHTASGVCVANFSLATNFLKKDGEKETTWHRMVAFGKTAELISNYVTKGSKILVEGRIQTRNYEAKDGSGKRYITEIVVQQLEFGDHGANKSQQPGSTALKQADDKGGIPSQPDPKDDVYLDDVPF